MFWQFFLPLIVSDFLCPTVFSFWLLPMMLVMVAAGKIPNSRVATGVLLSLSPVAVLWQVYFWTTWAAWCSSIAFHFALQSAHHWIYYLLAFAFCMGPISYLTSAERRAKETAEEVWRLDQSSFLYSLFLVIAYIVISIWPHLIEVVFWWFPRSK